MWDRSNIADKYYIKSTSRTNPTNCYFSTEPRTRKIYLCFFDAVFYSFFYCNFCNNFCCKRRSFSSSTKSACTTQESKKLSYFIIKRPSERYINFLIRNVYFYDFLYYVSKFCMTLFIYIRRLNNRFM